MDGLCRLLERENRSAFATTLSVERRRSSAKIGSEKVGAAMMGANGVGVGGALGDSDMIRKPIADSRWEMTSPFKSP